MDKTKEGRANVDRVGWAKDTLTDALYRCQVTKGVVDIGSDDAPITWERTDTTWVDSRSYEVIADGWARFGRRVLPKDKFVQADAQNLSMFKDKQFSVALLTELMEHVPDPIKALKEACRVADMIIITVPNEYDWDAKWKPFQNSSHVRCYTKGLLAQHTKEASGFDPKIETLAYDGWSFFVTVLGFPVMEGRLPATDSEPVSIGQGQVSRPLHIGLFCAPFMPCPPVGYGGLEVVMYDLAVALAELGHKVTVFGADGSHAEGCEVVTYGPPVLKVAVDWLEAERKAYETVKEKILSNGYDVIHSHDWFGFPYNARVLNPKLKVCHTHHGHINQQWWKSTTAPFPLNMFAISNWMKTAYQQQGGFNGRVVYNGISLKKYGFKAEKGNRLLFVARADTFKQPHVTIEVAKRLGLGLDLVCGTFVQSDAYMEQIKSACDGQQIRWVQDPPQDEKVKLMQDALCLIAPSKMLEPFGLMCAEANACGTPAIGLRDGAIPEVIEHGVTGYVCDTTEEICEAVKKVDQIDPMACRRRVEQHFSREIMAKNYLAGYMDILNGKEW